MAEEIPKQGKAGVVVNEGNDFKVEVQMIDVPEPSEYRKEAKPIGSHIDWQGTMSSLSV